MAISGQGPGDDYLGPEASAHSAAEALAFPPKKPRSKKPLTPDQMAVLAKKLRRHVITIIGRAGSGHPGGSLSAVEIVTALYFNVLCHDPANPGWEDRDRLILSKGHAAPLVYAALAECGYFPLKELETLRTLGSCLQGHCDATLTPGVEMSSGSLGQGLSFGIGVALAGRLDRRDYRVYVLLGDGECDEGQVWEAAMAGPHFSVRTGGSGVSKLDNLVAIVDHNKLQIDGWNSDVMNIEPLADKWRAFGWHTVEINGHDFDQVLGALDQAKEVKGKPTAIVAQTVKGKGVSFMEGNVDFHGKAPTPDEVERALRELS